MIDILRKSIRFTINGAYYEGIWTGPVGGGFSREQTEGAAQRSIDEHFFWWKLKIFLASHLHVDDGCTAALHCKSALHCNPLIFWECGHEMCHRFVADFCSKILSHFSLTWMSLLWRLDWRWRLKTDADYHSCLPAAAWAPNSVTRANGICLFHTFRNGCWLQLHLQAECSVSSRY